MYRLVIPLVLLLAGCAANSGPNSGTGATDAKQIAKINDALKGLTPGKPQSCIDQTRVRNVNKFEGTILYQYSPREIYRNDVDGGCAGLRYGDIIVSRTMSGELCSGDIIKTVSPGSHMPSGSCGLGQFIPYTR